MVLLAFGVVGGEDPPPAVEVDVARLDGEHLLRPATGLPAHNKKLAELLGSDLADEPGVLRPRDDHVPSASPRFLDVADWASLDQPHLHRPVEGSLNGRD